MKRFLPQCMIGLVCLMALAFATPDANALTPLGTTADQPATLAIQPAPTNTIDSFDTVPLILLSASTAALPGTRTDNSVAWRSMPLKISVTAALTANKAATTTTKIDSDQVTARAAPTSEANALTCYPNTFNGPTQVTALTNRDTSPETAGATSLALVSTAGGQPLCRAVMFALTSPVENFEPKMAA